jgi:Flp pilus assembly protein TadG
MILSKKLGRKLRQRGFVLVVMTVSAIALVGAMGLAIDLGHIFIVKNETQAYVDAASIAAALQMDGTTAGITRANTAATSLSDAWNFSSTKLTSPTVEFGATTSGTWYTAANVTAVLAPTMMFARITKTVAPNVYFVPVVMASPVYTQNVQSQAISGQVDLPATASIPAGLGPFTSVAACSGNVTACEASGPNFGLTVGEEYDLQWPQYNSNRQGCGNGKGNGNGNSAANCFVSPPCAGDVAIDNLPGNAADPMIEVVQNWGPSVNGYWGSNSTSVINQYILDAKQLQALTIGDDITPDLASGNKQGTAKVLDDRVNQDTVNYDPSSATTSALKLSTYLANSSHNGRRLMPVPMVYPNGTGSQVVGYGMFLLESDQSSAGGTSGYYAAGKGNDPYCAIFAGPWVMGGSNGGVGGSGGGSRVRLVQ